MYARTRVYIYTYTCPCAWVNAVSRPFFREGGLSFPNLSTCVYNMPTVSTISRPCLLVVQSVHRLCNLSTNYAQCLQTLLR